MQKIHKYNVLKKLGSGSFGFVYLAQDPKLHVQVAIKVFKIKDATLLSQVTSTTSDPIKVLKQRFIDEAQILRKLSCNPHIVEMYEFDELEDGTPYYVMPYIRHTLMDELGKDIFSQEVLEETLKEHYPKKIPPAQAIRYLTQISQALCAVHENGLVHRDIKPANILINEKGQVQLSDFGIAKLPLSEHSQTGFGMGSKNYMSPEQQETAKHVKPASDIYSLAVLAYRMLTGQLPVGRFQDPIEYAPEIGQPLNELILQSLSQDAKLRPKNGSEFLSALNRTKSSQESNPSDINQNITQPINKVMTQNIEEDTLIWSSQSPLQIKPELTTLENKIIELLHKQGEIKLTDIPLLLVLGDIHHLDKSAITTFVDFIIEQQSSHSSQLKSFILWVKTVNKHFQTKAKILSASDINILMEAGLSATDQSAEQLTAILQVKQQEYSAIHQVESVDTATNNDAKNQLKHKNKQLNPQQFSRYLFNSQRSNKLLLLGILLITLTVSLIMFSQYQKQQEVINNDLQEWILAKKKNTEASYKHYLQSNSAGNYIAEAKRGLSDLLKTTEAQTTNNIRLRQQQISNAQRQLIKHGFELTLTGEIDKRTSHAIKTFEKKEGLMVTGDVDDLLIKKLAEIYQEKDVLSWKEAQAKHSIAAYQQYHTAFPQGQYASLASNTIKKLYNEQEDRKKLQRQATEKRQQETISQAINKLLNSFITLPSGKYTMGCTQESECKKRETPAHTVSINTFRIMATEVTFTLWDACVLSGNCTIKPIDEGWGRDNRPVIGISHTDIVREFIPWLNNETGIVFSLPSEAQWEYAAKAGSDTKYSWGNNIDCQNAQFGQFSGICGNERKTLSVKSYTPNEFGLYDMHGNVWEWTQDCWHNSYISAPTDGRAWNNTDCDAGVIRGGSWLNEGKVLHSEFRRGYLRSNRSNTNGFRLVINAPKN